MVPSLILPITEVALAHKPTDTFQSNVKADRSHAVRDNHIAERDAKVVSPDGHGSKMVMVIDGMDQAKWQCPRNLASSASQRAETRDT